MHIKLKYKIGEKIKTESKVYEVIGFDYIIERGIRYCLLHVEGGKTQWEYLHLFEIEALKIK